MNRSRPGRLGVWSWLDSVPYADAIDFAQSIERLGYSALWVPEAVGRDPFVTLSVLAPHVDSLWLATGVANIYARDAMAMNSARRSLGELCKGRLVLGLGVSHAEIVTSMRQHDYGKPVATMQAYLKAMDEALYVGPDTDCGLRVLAALRPRMLAAAGECSDGAHPYFVTPEHTARAREILGPDSWLAPEQTVLLVKDASEARRISRQYMATYLGLRNYRENLKTLGFTDADFEHGGSDRLVDALIAWGDESTLQKRVEAHWAAGADHVCIQPLRPDGQQGFDTTVVRALAPS